MTPASMLAIAEAAAGKRVRGTKGMAEDVMVPTAAPSTVSDITEEVTDTRKVWNVVEDTPASIWAVPPDDVTAVRKVLGAEADTVR